MSDIESSSMTFGGDETEIIGHNNIRVLENENQNHIETQTSQEKEKDKGKNRSSKRLLKKAIKKAHKTQQLLDKAMQQFAKEAEQETDGKKETSKKNKQKKNKKCKRGHGRGHRRRARSVLNSSSSSSSSSSDSGSSSDSSSSSSSSDSELEFPQRGWFGPHWGGRGFGRFPPGPPHHHRPGDRPRSRSRSRGHGHDRSHGHGHGHHHRHLPHFGPHWGPHGDPMDFDRIRSFGEYYNFDMPPFFRGNGLPWGQDNSTERHRDFRQSRPRSRSVSDTGHCGSHSRGHHGHGYLGHGYRNIPHHDKHGVRNYEGPHSGEHNDKRCGSKSKYDEENKNQKRNGEEIIRLLRETYLSEH